MAASDHLSADQFPSMGDKFAHRHMLSDRATRADVEADPDNPKHYDRYVVTQVGANTGAVSYKPHPTRQSDRARTVSADKFSELAIPLPARRAKPSS